MSTSLPPCVALCLSFAFLAACDYSRSEIVSYEFTGIVTTVDPALATEFSVGESVVGSFAYDTAAAATFSSDNTSAFFYEALTDFNAWFGNDYLVTEGPALNGVTFNNTGSNTNDTFLALAEHPNASSVAGLDPLVIFIGFIDNDSIVFDSLPSDTLPLVLPDISEFESILATFIFDDAPTNRLINFDVLTLNRVPEPQSILLLSLASLIYLRRR